MLQIIFCMVGLAVDMVEEASAVYTCEITFKELSIVSAVYRNAKIGTVNHRWPARQYDHVCHSDDNLALAIAQVLHERCTVGAVPDARETDEDDEGRGGINRT